MVDTQGLGPCEKSCGFKSLHPHHYSNHCHDIVSNRYKTYFLYYIDCLYVLHYYKWS